MFTFFDDQSWERILKFYAVQFVNALAVSFIIYMMIILFLLEGGVNSYLFYILSISVILLGQMMALSVYESWRGCEVKKY